MKKTERIKLPKTTEETEKVEEQEVVEESKIDENDEMKKDNGDEGPIIRPFHDEIEDKEEIIEKDVIRLDEVDHLKLQLVNSDLLLAQSNLKVIKLRKEIVNLNKQLNAYKLNDEIVKIKEEEELYRRILIDKGRNNNDQINIINEKFDIDLREYAVDDLGVIRKV
jgi:hypothetical protein